MDMIFSHEVLLAFAVCMGAAMATLLGALAVVYPVNRDNARLLSFGLAFAGGAMVYVSLVEIFNKSHIAFLDIYGDQFAYGYATLFFFIGVTLLVVLDRFIPNPHANLTEEEIVNKKHVGRIGLMAALAITAHNFPEGLATFFATLDNPVVGAPLAVAIAIHNIPEGVSIAIPVYYATGSRRKAFFACLLSALAEPVGALIGYLVLAPYLSPFIYGAVFAVIAGAMVFLAVDELLPAAKRYSKGHEPVYGLVLGMAALALSLVLFR